MASLKSRLPARRWLSSALELVAQLQCSRYGHHIHAAKMDRQGSTPMFFYYCGRGCGIRVRLEYEDGKS